MNKYEKELALFNLGKSLVDLLGEEQAIADLELLLKRHPEMFKDMKEVKELIDKVVSEPEIIINNPSPKSEKDYIVGKKLNDKKMGEVGIRKDENISKIFHANEKNIKKLRQLDKKEVIYKKQVVGTPNSYTQAQSLDERLVQKNISPANENILTNSTYKSQAMQGEKVMDMLRQEYEQKDISKEFERKDFDKNKIKKGKI
ncbi:MAG TPA: hypothetical protein K8V51_01880 [Campylobacter avium]|uniref:hypothetical protein n=1 Tax=Campylobacter avium TaxID=522485 RepID=UPI001D9CA007|nr:hypothetical protein [Campylobacter avium]HJE65797.1 hypothetical protein [Campylobacter avium]